MIKRLAPIATARLALEPCRLRHLEVLLNNAEDFSAIFGWNIIPGYCESSGALEFSLQKLKERNSPSPWWAPFLVIHRRDKALIGLAGYKGPPDPSGSVEIGYGIAPANRGKGLATETARALMEYAFEDPTVRAVLAHTPPGENPSVSVLRKCGLKEMGSVMDRIDGKVTRWQMTRTAFQAHSVL